MAIFYLRTSIVKAASGKSVVAASAYQSASSLHSNRLGQTFQYQNKEEVIHSEVLLPDHAPVEYKDREKLWNAVEKSRNKSNSRFARQFVIGLPVEWTKEECIEHSREFIQTVLVDAGMCVDWSFHDKQNKGNPHLHLLCTCGGINPDGTFASMEKKAYVLDENGERVPEIDSETGEQKIRIRRKNGKEYVEKIWKRTTVQANQWNSRQFLKEVKQAWADTCNKYLAPDQQIDHRSYTERKINRVSLVHEGPEARAALKRGIVFEVIKENQERRRLNEQLAKLEQFITEARKILQELKNRLEKWRKQNDQKRSNRTNKFGRGDGIVTEGLSGTYARNDDRTRSVDNVQRLKEESDKLEKRSKKIHRKR